MNRTLIGFACGIAVTIGVGLTTAQDAGEHGGEGEMGDMSYMMPGPVHEDIMLRAGTFRVETRMTMMPGTEPTITHGKATMKPILGGRFLIEDSAGEMMGMPYTGHRMWGYNNATDKFESVWTYTLSTGILFITGTPQEDGTVVGMARWTEPTGEMKAKVIFSSPDPDHITIQMMSPPEMGDEFLMFEERFTRE